MILISNDFCHNIKKYNVDPYNVLLSIATNIAVLLMTASVLQGHILSINYMNGYFIYINSFSQCLEQPAKRLVIV